ALEIAADKLEPRVHDPAPMKCQALPSGALEPRFSRGWDKTPVREADWVDMQSEQIPFVPSALFGATSSPQHARESPRSPHSSSSHYRPRATGGFYGRIRRWCPYPVASAKLDQSPRRESRFPQAVRVRADI